MTKRSFGSGFELDIFFVTLVSFDLNGGLMIILHSIRELESGTERETLLAFVNFMSDSAFPIGSKYLRYDIVRRMFKTISPRFAGAHHTVEFRPDRRSFTFSHHHCAARLSCSKTVPTCLCRES